MPETVVPVAQKPPEAPLDEAPLELPPPADDEVEPVVADELPLPPRELSVDECVELAPPVPPTLELLQPAAIHTVAPTSHRVFPKLMTYLPLAAHRRGDIDSTEVGALPSSPPRDASLHG